MNNDFLTNFEDGIIEQAIDENEKVLLVIKGRHGHVLIATSKQLLVLKHGLVSGYSRGEHGLSSFDYTNITGFIVSVKRNDNLLIIKTEGAENSNRIRTRGYGKNNALKSERAIIFYNYDAEKFQFVGIILNKIRNRCRENRYMNMSTPQNFDDITKQIANFEAKEKSALYLNVRKFLRGLGMIITGVVVFGFIAAIILAIAL
jgi:hypothetical protein